MKAKTWVTLERSTLAAVDAMTADGFSRSRLIEQAVVQPIERHHRQLCEERDLAILDQHTDALEDEMRAVLAYQVEI
jgi:metal-responsive CopG/Arc/MetJ family transcriptional regulator